jgi:hypothetical protein
MASIEIEISPKVQNPDVSVLQSKGGRSADRTIRTRMKRYRTKHPEMAGKIDRGSAQKQTARRRGMTNEEFEDRIRSQGGRCPIGDHEFVGRGLGRQSPARDHCHTTGKDRAILCSEHNRALGMFHDSPEELQAALAYLREWTVKHANS